MAVDRSKRYENSPKGAKKHLQDKDEDKAAATAKETAGSPPTAEDPKGAIHKTDDGPAAGTGPAIGMVAERHGTEMGAMHKRHGEEMASMHERHAKDHDELRKRHMKEVEAPNKDESGAEKSVDSDGKGPKLGKTEDEGKKGTEP